MATAFLFPLANLFARLQAFADWLAARPEPVPCVVHRPAHRVAMARPPKPLRVVRVLEPSAPRAEAGRMVISGRLADVCAELDRLAAQEAGR